MKDKNPLSISVVRAIAEEEGSSPRKLDFTLHEYIEPEILDKLQSNGPRKWSLDFVAGGHHVSVNQDGQIIVDKHAGSD